MNESDLDRAKEGDLDLGTEEGGIGAGVGETGAETPGPEETEVGRKETEAGTEKETGEKIGRRSLDIDLEKEGAAGVATEVDDLEVQLHVLLPKSKEPSFLECQPEYLGELIYFLENTTLRGISFPNRQEIILKYLNFSSIRS